MRTTRTYRAGILACLLAVGRLWAANPAGEISPLLASVDETRLFSKVAAPDCVAMGVNFPAQVLWAAAANRELFLQTTNGILRVKLESSALPRLQAGDMVLVTGKGMAGQGVLDSMLADNDGLHSASDASGTIRLERGRIPFHADWFNDTAEGVFEVEYAGPNLPRQRIPDGAFSREGGGQGLNFRCFPGTWEQLPYWRDWLPNKTGVVSNLDVSARPTAMRVGMEFTGFINIDEPGDYTFWVKSDDGSRFAISDLGLHVTKTGVAPLPTPRQIKPGQSLTATNNFFWAEMEGVVTGVHTDPNGNVIVNLDSESGSARIEIAAPNMVEPELFSRLRAKGLCHAVKSSGGAWVAGQLMVSAATQVTFFPATPKPCVTTLAGLRDLSTRGYRCGANLCLTGVVLNVLSPAGLFAFQDATGGVLVQPSPDDPPLRPGQRIVVRGSGALDRNRLSLSPSALVDNDGLHQNRDRESAQILRQGKTPVHVSWFNRVGPSALEVYYRGPGVRRQKIPDAALVHPEIQADGSVKWAQGLNWVGYHGDWHRLPDFTALRPAGQGVTKNFDINTAGRLERVGLEFSGYLDVPRDGEYVFTVSSDDGAMLFLDEHISNITPLEIVAVPAPVAIAPRQKLELNQDYHWSEVEGVVNYVHEHDGSLQLELTSGYGSMNVEIADGSDGSPKLLLGSQVRLRGFCEGVQMPDGQSVAANFLVPGLREVTVLQSAANPWNRYPLENTGRLNKKNLDNGENLIRLSGKIIPGGSSGTFRFHDEAGDIPIELVQPPTEGFDGAVEVLGRLVHSETNLSLACALWRRQAGSSGTETNKAAMFTSILPIKQLSREEAQAGVPVRIRGVVTLVRGNTGFILQDESSAIDVWWTPYSIEALPRTGDYWEVEGETFVEFSPNIRARRAVRLGPGVMPAPLHPEWEQLLNGSLDTRYVEVQGIVTDCSDNSVTLFTRAGKINVLLSPAPEEPLSRHKDALVRIRGCVVPIRNSESWQIEVGQTRLSNFSLEVDEPAPEDPFDVVTKHSSELLQFDARAGSLRRVKILGQVLHARDEKIYLADGTNVFSVTLQKPEPAKPGDLVETVGFPELGGSSPVLREALLRRTGSAPLPSPRPIVGDALFNLVRDGEFISLEARLVGVSGNKFKKVLELQSGNREVVARVDDPTGILGNMVEGSRLRLAGIYVDERGRAGVPAGSPFEIMLNSPADLTVLQRPPWWTPQHMAITAGILMFMMFAAAFWIVQLQRRVDEAAAKLEEEVRHREKIQHQNLLERERARIARDMHDQLGTSVTQVGLLAELTKKELHNPAKAAGLAEQICQSAIDLGRTLDAIVWTVNPKNDSLNKFCDYVAVHTQEFFQLTDILCRVDLPPEMPAYPLSAEIRHNLFLATREALNNVVRHSRAREVWMRFKLLPDKFLIVIADDGRGFAPEEAPASRNGMTNMQKRMNDIGAKLELHSQPGKGTEVIFALPLPMVEDLKQN